MMRSLIAVIAGTIVGGVTYVLVIGCFAYNDDKNPPLDIDIDELKRLLADRKANNGLSPHELAI